MAKTLAYSVARIAAIFQIAVTPYLLAQPLHPEQRFQEVSSGEIKGRISLSRQGMHRTPSQTESHSNRYFSHGEHAPADMKGAALNDTIRLSQRAVVFLENDALSQKQYPLPEKHPILDQKNLQFQPQVLPILVGTTVDFPNRDDLYHNVFSYSRPREFDLGRYPKGDSRSVTFDQPGIVRVYCDIHSHMNATVIVLEHPYFATPLDTGDFSISNIPEGTYNVVFWLDRNEVERRVVRVNSGKSIQVDFSN
jgi:plastocyanin